MKKNEINLSQKVFQAWLVLFLTLGMALLLIWPKGTILLFINQHRTPILDLFFQVITYLGDGLIAIPVLIYLLFQKYSHALKFTLMSITLGLITYFCKSLWFDSIPRPGNYPGLSEKINFIPGVIVHHFDSFPSGHTATIFGLVTFFVFTYRPKASIVGLLFFMATLVGLSRIYMLQHFFMDVYFGALLGSSVGWIIEQLIQPAIAQLFPLHPLNLSLSLRFNLKKEMDFIPFEE